MFDSIKKIAIIIPTFNRKHSLKSLLGRLLSQITIIDIEVNIVVVVDGSTDGTLEMLDKMFPDVHIVKGDGNWWFTKSVNMGCRYAIDKLKASYIMTLNDDVGLSDNFLSTMIETVSTKNTDILVCSMSLDYKTRSKITYSGVEVKRKWTGSSIPRIKYGTIYDRKVHNGIHFSNPLPTRGLIFSSTIYESVNGLDEVFPQYASDDDFVYRANKKGFKSYINYDAILYEKEELTGPGSPRQTTSFSFFVKNWLFNKYSPTYLPNKIRMIWRHKTKFLFPIYLITSLIGTFKSFFKYK